MRLLLDTQLLIWASSGDRRLSPQARTLIVAPDTEPCFSAISLLEIAIKWRLRRPDFQIEPNALRRGLIDNGYVEVPVTGAHAAAVALLPDLHKDPFDRLLVAQAAIEGATLLTADAKLDGYPGPIRRV